jgi:hypothetical protein
MTPQALARLTEISNRKMVSQITRMARRFGVTEAMDALDRYKPNIKNPAQSMLRERELLSVVLDEVLERMGADETSVPLPPPPRRARSNASVIAPTSV